MPKKRVMEEMSESPGGPSKKRWSCLTLNRSNKIKEFKSSYVGSQAGSAEWMISLYKYLQESNSHMKFSDLERWVGRYQWILGPEQEEDDSFCTTLLTSPQPSPAHPVAAVVPSEISSESSSSLPALTNEAMETSQAEVPVQTTTLPTNSGNRTTTATLQTHPQSLSVANANLNATEYLTHSNNASQAEPTLMDLTQNSAPVMTDEFKMKCFLTAFQAIGDLHEVCKLLPEARVCLRPLREIHHTFSRNHEKFIFPEDYTGVMAASTAQVKYDLNGGNSLQPPTITLDK